MSCEIIVRQCERCDLTEGTVLCQECAGKEESDPVCYCVTCSELVHKGRIAKHTLTLLESGISQVTKDEAESLITKYKREVACLSKKIDEVDKAKENISEFMQKHDKAIRQTITAVVRQLQERGKSFIQQVAVRSNEKKEQLTAIQAQLQDAQKDISEQIGNLEEIIKKSDTKDKAEIASIDATLKDIEAEVQGKIDETFKSVKLPELDTEFGIDTSCVSEAVQALQINIHPEPSDEVIAERNNIEVPDLKISQDAEKAEIEAFVSGSLTRNGLFWTVPRFSKEVETKLFRLSMLIRKMYIENATWKSFGDSGTQPTVGGDVYALYDADHKWYRGRVEDTKSSRNGSTVRFTDYGNTQNVTHVNILAASDSLAPQCTQQAVRCCLHETLEKPLPNEARWAFSDATGEAALNLTFQKQVTRDGCSAWLVDVKVALTDGIQQDVNAIVRDKVIEDSQPKSTIMCKDIRYTNVNPSSGTGVPGWAKGSDVPMSTAGSSMSRRLASEDQMSNLAQISAILGSGGGMRRECKLDEVEIKRRQKKRERKESKHARKPEAACDHEAAGEQQEIDADKVHTDEVDGYPAKLGIMQSHVLPALGLEHIVPTEGAVDGARTTANSAGDGDRARSSTRSDDVNEAIDPTNSIADTQQCTAETGEEQSKGGPDTVVSVDSSSGGAKAVVVSPADTDIQLITSASPPLDGGVTLSHTESATTSLDSGHTTSLPHGDNTCLPQDAVVSSPKDDATIASSDGCISVPKSDDVALPQCVATSPVTSESPVVPLCSDNASTTVIDLGTEAIGEPLCHPGTVCDSAEPVTTVDASLEVTGHVHSVTETLEDNDVAMSQDSVEEPIAGTAAIPCDICCDDVIVPSIPQTDGAADVVGETTPAASDACLSVALDDDRPERECDVHIDVALVDGDIIGDSVKSYRVSPPPQTPPSIRALSQSAGDEPVAIDTDLKQCQLADGDSNVSDSDVWEKSNNMHDDHTKKPDASEGTANSDSTQRDIVAPDRLAHSSIKPTGCKPKSTAPPIETVLPKAKLYHGGEFQVRVTSELQKNGQFWVELVRDSLAEGAYQHMLSQFKEMANISASVHSVTPGILVLSPGEKDSWHRGRVSEVKGCKVDVCLIDCGRNISVHMDNLKELYDRFHRIPYQAVMCSIARKDYTQFGEKGQQLFKEKVRGRELLVKVITVGGTGSFVFIDLLDCLGPEPCNIYQLIYDKIPEERPVKQIPRPGAPVQTCVRNGEHGETVVPYSYVTVPVSIQSGMPVSLTMPYQPVPVLGDSSNAEPVCLMPDANPRPKLMAGYIPSMPFYTTSAVYTASSAKYTVPPQLLPPGGMPVDSSSCAGTMPPVSYVPVSHHDVTGSFCTKATMQGSGDATHNHVTYIPSLLPDGATHQDVHSSQPSSATGSEIECDDDVWVEEDRKMKQMDKHNWRQRSDHQDRHYHGGGGGQLWGRAKDDIICYGCQKRGHMNRDCPNFNRRPNLMDPAGSWSGKGRDSKRGSRGGGGGGGRGGPRGVDSNRGSASSHRSSSGRKHRNSRPSGGRQNYTGDEGGPAVSSGGRMSGRKSSWQAESWED